MQPFRYAYGSARWLMLGTEDIFLITLEIWDCVSSRISLELGEA